MEEASIGTPDIQSWQSEMWVVAEVKEKCSGRKRRERRFQSGRHWPSWERTTDMCPQDGKQGVKGAESIRCDVVQMEKCPETVRMQPGGQYHSVHGGSLGLGMGWG